MRIESTPQTHTPPATEKNHEPHTPRANAKAHGVVRKFGTDHYNPTAEARLLANFGHLLPTEPDTTDVQTDPVTDPVDEVTDPLTDPAGDPATEEPTTPTEPSVDLLA